MSGRELIDRLLSYSIMELKTAIRRMNEEIEFLVFKQKVLLCLPALVCSGTRNRVVDWTVPSHHIPRTLRSLYFQKTQNFSGWRQHGRWLNINRPYMFSTTNCDSFTLHCVALRCTTLLSGTVHPWSLRPAHCVELDSWTGSTGRWCRVGRVLSHSDPELATALSQITLLQILIMIITSMSCYVVLLMVNSVAFFNVLLVT